MNRKPRSHVRILIYRTWAISTRLTIREQSEDTEDEFWREKSRNKSYEALATLKAV